MPIRHVDATFLYKYVKIQPIATYTSHVHANYVPETNMPTNFDKVAIYGNM